MIRVECAKLRTKVKAEELGSGDQVSVKATYFDDYNQLPNLDYSFHLKKYSFHVEGVIRNSRRTSYEIEFEDRRASSVLKSCIRKAHHDLNEN